MSRVAKNPVTLPQGVTATIAGEQVTIKGSKGSLNLPISPGVSVAEKDKTLQVSYSDADGARMRAGSVRAHLANMVAGVTKGYERKLELVGVGFRAAVAGKSLNLTLGFSHQVVFAIPKASRSRRRPRPRCSSRVSTSSASARLPRKSVASVRPSLQGQGREIRRREDHVEGRQEEVA